MSDQVANHVRYSRFSPHDFEICEIGGDITIDIGSPNLCCVVSLLHCPFVSHALTTLQISRVPAWTAATSPSPPGRAGQGSC